ncbi:MAG: glycosyltransferase family 9 protein [Candidatus Eremiobacteraeota bacterium]|nr:glycosyltransferase family 9 protein [Candidatus Eremiobacteraeota bacterium]MBV8222326.1 glycosyltransferase family 9 protein [Candidatus Eremiobacteraeota bacterium]
MIAAAPSFSRILLVRTDRLGDLVLSTPAIASFRRSWPHARIEAVVSDYNEPVLRFNTDIDELHTLPRSATRDEARSLMRRLGADVDLAVALAPRTADYRLAAWTGAPQRLGYVYRRRYLSRVAAGVMLTAHAISEADPDLADRFPDRPIAHEVHQVLSLVRLAGGEALTDSLVLDPGDEARGFARALVPAGAVGLNLAPRWFENGFDADAVGALIQELAAENADVLVTYGADVATAAERVRASVASARVRWLVLAQPLHWIAALGQCAVVVTVDCGAVHVAAAQGVPVVAVYERRYYRLSSQEWSPWRVPSVVLCKPPAGASSQPLLGDIVAGVRTLRSVPAPVS